MVGNLIAMGLEDFIGGQLREIVNIVDFCP